MNLLPVSLIFTATAAAGLALAYFHHAGVRKPVLTGFHLLLGAGTLETFLVLQGGRADGGAGAFAPSATIILCLLAAAMFTGLARPLLRTPARPKGPQAVLAAHVGMGLLAFALFLVWVANA